VDMKLKYKDRWTFDAVGRMIINVNHERRRRFYANELLVSYRSKKWVAKLGKQVIDWGHHTGVSPLDILNRYDYYDVIDTDDEILGSWSFEYELFFNTTTIKILGIASRQYSRLHIGDNRWGRLPQFIKDSQTGNLLPLSRISTNNRFSDRDMNWGIRLSQEINDITLRADYFIGENDIPQRSQKIIKASEQGIEYALNLTYHSIETFQLSATTFIGNWNIWLDYAMISNRRILQRENTLSKDNYNVLSLGGDVVFSFENPEKQFQLLLQYMNISADPIQPYVATDIDHIFSNAIISRLLYRWNYKLSTECKTVFDLEKDGYLVSPALTYRVSDSIHLSISSEFMGGDVSGFFGAASNSRINCGAKYFFQ